MEGLTSRTTELQVESIIVTGENTRQVFDQQKLLDLGESMQSNTQLQPVIVNEVGGRMYLIAGERRLRAAKMAGKTFIEAKVFTDLTPGQVLRMRIAENRDREQLNAIEEARGMAMLRDEGCSVEEIAGEYHMSASTVSKRLSLLRLPDEVQRMVTRDKNPLPVHQALLLATLSESDALRIARQACDLGTVAGEAQVRAWVDEAREAAAGPKLIDEGKEKTKTKKPPRPVTDEDLGTVEVTRVNIGGSAGENFEPDKLFDEAVRITIAAGRGSQTRLQRRLDVNLARASWMIDKMVSMGILESSHAGAVLKTQEEYEASKKSRVGGGSVSDTQLPRVGTWWRVGGSTGTGSRAQQVGRCIGGGRNHETGVAEVVLRFEDGKMVSFGVHEIFPAEPPAGAASEEAGEEADQASKQSCGSQIKRIRAYVSINGELTVDEDGVAVFRDAAVTFRKDGEELGTSRFKFVSLEDADGGCQKALAELLAKHQPE